MLEIPVNKLVKGDAEFGISLHNGNTIFIIRIIYE